MSNKKVKLSILGLIVIVVGTVGMFATVFAYSNYVHYPLLGRLCVSSCEKTDRIMQKVETGYVASSITEGCVCVSPDDPNDISAGYFLTSIGALDWFLLVWMRLIPLAIILFLFVLVIAKIVGRGRS